MGVITYPCRNISLTTLVKGVPVSWLCRRLIQTAWWRHQMETLMCYWPLWGESTGHRWIPLTNASDAELWCFLCLNKLMCQQSRRWLFETSSHLCWRHCNEYVLNIDSWFCYALFWSGHIISSDGLMWYIGHKLQGYFTATTTTVRLSGFQSSNPEGYG